MTEGTIFHLPTFPNFCPAPDLEEEEEDGF
jgi:hypothetical protein